QLRADARLLLQPSHLRPKLLDLSQLLVSLNPRYHSHSMSIEHLFERINPAEASLPLAETSLTSAEWAAECHLGRRS
ncbi:MAG TPA: hypothetical protein VIP28_13155, partial [Nocardioides sp.]